MGNVYQKSLKHFVKLYSNCHTLYILLNMLRKDKIKLVYPP